MGKIEQFIKLLEKQYDSKDDYSASEFLTQEYKENEVICVGIIYFTFRKDNYLYARDVLYAIKFSDIPYLQQEWYKKILLEGMQVEKIKNTFSKEYDLYKEILDKVKI